MGRHMQSRLGHEAEQANRFEGNSLPPVFGP